MSKTTIKAVTVAIGTILCGATAAWAGDWVYGYGASRVRAMDDADTRAQRQAASAGTCYRQAKGQDCTQEEGEWVCRAEVTHHNRSAPGRVCPR